MRWVRVKGLGTISLELELELGDTEAEESW